MASLVWLFSVVRRKRWTICTVLAREELAEAGSFRVAKIYFAKIASAAFADDFPLSQLGRVKQSNFQLLIQRLNGNHISYPRSVCRFACQRLFCDAMKGASL